MNSTNVFTRFYGNGFEYLHNNITNLTYARNPSAESKYWVRVHFDLYTGRYEPLDLRKQGEDEPRFQYAHIYFNQVNKLWKCNYYSQEHVRNKLQTDDVNRKILEEAFSS